MEKKHERFVIYQKFAGIEILSAEKKKIDMNEYENQLKTHPDHFVIENIFSCIATDIFYCNELFHWLSWFIAIAKHFTKIVTKPLDLKTECEPRKKTGGIISKGSNLSIKLLLFSSKCDVMDWNYSNRADRFGMGREMSE